MFKKLLIANRGEIALRIIRACRELNIATVAVHSTADASALHVMLADESVCIGSHSSKDSYLNIPAIISAAEITQADAIHPGFGFLSENAKFAQIVKEHNITFIGPQAKHIKQMGDKIAAKSAMKKVGVPLVPGTDGAMLTITAAEKAAEQIGYPVLIKASAGGGGKGMVLCTSPISLEQSINQAKSESMAAFGDDTIYLEKYLDGPRHIEIQILADAHGNVVHLGERDCSLQRRHQKVLEEAPSPVISKDQRIEIGKVVTDAIKKLGFLGAGTIEFLYQDDKFYFIEMNTRIQVEHPITEMITGIDIVAEQIKIATGLPLSFTQEEICFKGHSIECRINAENPWTFLPSPGKIEKFHAPGGPGVRFDSAIYTDYVIPPYYDSMIGKLIVHAKTRELCINKLNGALRELMILGVEHTGPLFKRLLTEEQFKDGNYDIHWLEKWMASFDTD